MQIPPYVGALFILIFSLFNLACATAQSEKLNSPLVQPEYRLQEDRKAFDEVRSQTPEEKKTENDELAYLENLFANPLEAPAKIRDRFYKLLTKKRDRFSKDKTKQREAYVRQERQDREKFTRDIEASRKEFKNRKSSSEERKEFFADIELKRKDFYANQKEKRDDFESQIKDDRKNFEDYARDKTNDFNARHREFSAKQRDILKEKKDAQSGRQ